MRILPAATLSLAILAPLSAADDADAPACPSFGWPPNTVPVEHTDAVCNRATENDPRRAMNVMKNLEQSVASGNARKLQPEQSWYCPMDDGDESTDGALSTTDDDGNGGGFDPANPHHLTMGPSSVWIVQNRATTPVVVSWLAPATAGDVQTTIEVSALNNRISPAHKDPKAILQPGEWRKVDVRLGQLFNVRELDVSAGGGEPAPGRVLLRHRPGPISIRNRRGPEHLECPIPALLDPKPVQPPPPKSKDEPAPPKVDQKRPDFDYNKRCNAIPKMFRSEVPCPVDLYYVGVDTDWNTGSHMMPADYMKTIEGTELDKTTAADADSTTSQELSVVGKNDNGIVAAGGPHHPLDPQMCKEHHSFHLGVNPAANPEDPAGPFEKWDSPVAYLFTYTSHKFVARLRHDKTLVDEINIERTIVGDCPRERKKIMVDTKAICEGVGIEIGSGDEEQCKEEVLAVSDYPAHAMNATNTTHAKNATNKTAAATPNKIKPGLEEVCTDATCKANPNKAAASVQVSS